MDLRSYDPLDIDHAGIDVFESMRLVARQGHKSRLGQFVEMLGLVAGNARLSPADYYRYQLYDDARYTPEEKRRFIGNNRYWSTTLRVTDSRWCALTDDKLVTAHMLRSCGFAIPHIRALYHPYRSFPGAAALRAVADLRHYLAREASYPLFGKPVSGFESKGAVYLRAYDPERDELVLYDGERVGVAEFARAVDEYVSDPGNGFRRFRTQLGYLFQAVVEQHAEVTAVAGPTVATTRPYVVLEDDGPRILAMTWKIPGPGNFADNAAHPGNIQAMVDVDSGRVVRAVRGAGIQLEVLDRNPVTGAPLNGFRLPHFERLREVVLEGAALLPGIRIQGWDVALGPDGPVVLEINNGSGYTAPQLTSGRGFLTPEFLRFLERAEADNETWPWKKYFRQQEHGHRLGRTRGVMRLLQQGTAALRRPRGARSG